MEPVLRAIVAPTGTVPAASWDGPATGSGIRGMGIHVDNQ